MDEPRVFGWWWKGKVLVMRKVQAALVVLLLFGVVSAALAQYQEEKPSKFSIGLMNLLPMGEKLRGLKSMWLGPLLNFHLKRDEDDRPVTLLTFGIAGSGDAPEKASEMQITYTRLRRTVFAEGRSKYIGRGIGVYRLTYHKHMPWQTPVDATAYRPGVHVLYGQEFRDAYFAEIRLDLLPSWRGWSWTSICLNLGTRTSL